MFKIDRDEAGGKEVVALLRSGTLRVRDRLDLGRGDPARVTGLRRFHRGGLDTVTEATAGQVVVLRGLDVARIGDGFGAGAAGAGPGVRPAQPRHGGGAARRARPTGPVRRPGRLAEQDPLISLRVDGQSGDKRELRLSLYGEVQQQVIGSLLEEEYGVAVRFRDTAMICTERLRGTGAAVELIGTDPNPYLATVGLRVEPAPVGSGVDFGLEVELGSMPPAFFTAVESSVRSALLHGNHGWEVPDARVRMTHSGYWARQSHAHGTFDKSMSSTAGDFRDLTRLLMAPVDRQAGTVVCEPVHRFELEVPPVARPDPRAAGARRRRTAHHRAPRTLRVVGRGDGRRTGRRGAPADPDAARRDAGRGGAELPGCTFRPQA